MDGPERVTERVGGKEREWVVTTGKYGGAYPSCVIFAKFLSAGIFCSLCLPDHQCPPPNPPPLPPSPLLSSPVGASFWGRDLAHICKSREVESREGGGRGGLSILQLQDAQCFVYPPTWATAAASGVSVTTELDLLLLLPELKTPRCLLRAGCPSPGGGGPSVRSRRGQERDDWLAGWTLSVSH